MVFQLMLPGYCQIPLYKKVGGYNGCPETIIWAICGHTIVDSFNYRWLNQYRWRMYWNPDTQSYYAVRCDRLPNGKRVIVSMANEVLGLPWGAGHKGDQADHVDHNTLKNTENNLRKVTPLQNTVNRRKYNNSSRFKGVSPHGSGFRGCIRYNSQLVWFPVVRIDVEAALTYNYSAYLLHGEFAHLNTILENEMPSYERQIELYDMVVNKLKRRSNVGIL